MTDFPDRVPIRRIGGSDGNLAAVNSDNQLHVVLAGTVDNTNSSSTLLLADAVFTGTAANILDFGFIFVTVFSDVASATNGLSVQQSMDGQNWDNTDDYTVPAGTGKTYSFQPGAKWFRVVYTNGGTNQAAFRLQTIYKKTSSLASSHKIQDSIIDEDDAELVKAVISGQSDITGFFENISTYREALQVDAALVHRTGISEHAKRDLGATTTFDVAASSGDTTINVVATTGFVVGEVVRICNGAETVFERSHFHITAVDAGVSLTLDRPLDNAYEVGDNVIEIQIGMNVSGSLASPISFKLEPLGTERWQITRIMPTMLDDSAMDDGKFGGITAITNGVVIRTNINGVVGTLTHWKSNADLKDDMYDVTYSSKAAAGQHGLSARWTFTKAEFVVDLDGVNGDFLEILIQDDLTGLLDFEINAQGRLFGE